MKKDVVDWNKVDAEVRRDSGTPTVDLVPMGARVLNDEHDLEDERSFYAFLPPKLKDIVGNLPTEVYELSEQELQARIWGTKSADETSSRLRFAFWAEYDRVQAQNELKMDLSRVYYGICTVQYFYKKFVLDQDKLAWMLHPTVDYTLSIKEMHSLGMTALRRALALDPTAGDNGRPNTKLIEAQFKIMQHLDMRFKGAIIQRIDQRNLNVNMNAEAPPETADKMAKVTKMTMEELDRDIAQLRKTSEALQAPSILTVDLMRDTRPEPVKIENAAEEE